MIKNHLSMRCHTINNPPYITRLYFCHINCATLIHINFKLNGFIYLHDYLYNNTKLANTFYLISSLLPLFHMRIRWWCSHSVPTGVCVPARPPLVEYGLWLAILVRYAVQLLFKHLSNFVWFFVAVQKKMCRNTLGGRWPAAANEREWWLWWWSWGRDSERNWTALTPVKDVLLADGNIVSRAEQQMFLVWRTTR